MYKRQVKVGARITARMAAGGYDETAEHISRLARVDFSGDGGDPVATVPVPGGAIEVLGGQELDLGAAERKLEERRAKRAAEIERAERKLANQGFVAKAPEEVVRAEREKLERLREELDSL